MKSLEQHRVHGRLFSKKHSPSYFLAFVAKTKSEKARFIIIVSIPYD